MAVGKTFGSNSVDGLVDRVLVDRYRVVEVVSAGANTVICSAFDIETAQPVTFKIVQPGSGRGRGLPPVSFARGQRSSLQSGIPTSPPCSTGAIIELDGESTVFWVVEHLGGGSLRDLFDRGRLP